MKKRLILLVILFSVCTILLSSCSAVSGFFLEPFAAKDIKSAVSSYFDQLIDGSLTESDYKSGYAKDSLFTELEMADDDARAIMTESLGAVTYQITDSKCEIVNKAGSCQVNITGIDVKAVLADLGKGYDAAAVRAALFAEDAPTCSEIITLQMTYNADTKKWMIADTTKIVKSIGTPYEEILFRPNPGDSIDLLITALSEGDAYTINSLSPNCPSELIFADALNCSELQTYFSLFDVVIDGDPDINGDTATVNVSISRPDIPAIWNHLSEDKEYMTELTKEYVLQWMQDDGNQIFYEEDMLDKMWPEGEVYFTDPSFRNERKVTFDLVYDQEIRQWTFVSIPTEFYSTKLDYEKMKDASDATAIAAMDLLLEEGSLDQPTYDLILDYYDQPAVVPNVSGYELIKDMDGDAYWSGYNDEGDIIDVTEYTAVDTYSILCFLDFNNDLSGVYLTLDWYWEDDTVPLSSNITKIIGGDSWAYAFCQYPDDKYFGDTLPAGTYRLVVSAADGTAVTESSIEVK